MVGGTLLRTGPGGLSMAAWSITSGTVSIDGALSYQGQFTQGAGATLGVAAGDKLNLSGASALSGTLNGVGTVVVVAATLNGLTVGGTATLQISGTASQTGAVTIGDAGQNAASLFIVQTPGPT